MDSASENIYFPNKELFDQSHITSIDEYKALYDKSINDGNDFWEHLGRTLLKPTILFCHCGVLRH